MNITDVVVHTLMAREVHQSCPIKSHVGLLAPTVIVALRTNQKSEVWHWRNGWDIHYECACGGRRTGKGEGGGGGKEEGEERGPERNKQGRAPLLLLPGFGVGTFHFRRNMREVFM